VKKYGTRSVFNCSQDVAHKRVKKSTKEDVKHRDNLGMDRFPCDSKLNVRVVHTPGYIAIEVHIEHHHRHETYFDIQMPAEAIVTIRENVWTTPAIIATHVRAKFPNVTTSQIRNVWKKFNENLWHRDIDQAKSARILLGEFPDDVDMFEFEAIEGVEAIGWGLKSVASQLRDVIEVAMDVTCKWFIDGSRLSYTRQGNMS
jgi:hypothetical protein